MTLDHDFGYSFPLFPFLLKKKEEEKENEVTKIVIKSHAFLLDQFLPLDLGNTNSSFHLNKSEEL